MLFPSFTVFGSSGIETEFTYPTIRPFILYNSWLLIYSQSCATTTAIRMFPSSPRETQPAATPHLLPRRNIPQPQAPLSFPTGCVFWSLHMNTIVQHMAFVSVLSLSTMSLSLISVVSHISALFHLLPNIISLYGYTTFCLFTS